MRRAAFLCAALRNCKKGIEGREGHRTIFASVGRIPKKLPGVEKLSTGTTIADAAGRLISEKLRGLI